MSKAYRSPEQPEIDRFDGYDFERVNQQDEITREKALPRRNVVIAYGSEAVLACGHRLGMPGNGSLPVGFEARCRDCYWIGLEEAGRMIEQACDEGKP